VRIVVGLGNPGRKYRHTRHNIGWMALDELAADYGGCREEDAPGGVLGRCGDTWLFKPLSYMNLCGPPVASFCRRVGVDLADLLVLVDDLNLPLGSLRLKPQGSSGGHNGLVSLIAALGTEEFARLRMGIGPVPEGMPWRDFVLGKFMSNERAAAEELARQAARAARCWADAGIVEAMNRFNATVRSEQDS
jgi:PTH1 family peptidyl-tRNA hydrolase